MQGQVSLKKLIVMALGANIMRRNYKKYNNYRSKCAGIFMLAIFFVVSDCLEFLT